MSLLEPGERSSVYSKKKRLLNSKGSITYFVMFIVIAISLIFMAAVVIPFSQKFNVKIYEQAEKMYDDNIGDLDKINDANVRERLTNSMTAARDTIPTQILALDALFTYSWILIMILTVLVLFVLIRRDVERDVGAVP